MISKVIGPTGDYADWNSFEATIPSTHTDDYDVEIQAGTYSETMDHAKNNGGYHLYIHAAPGATVVFDGQDTRNYGAVFSGTGGKTTVEGIEFKNALWHGFRCYYSSTALLHVIGCRFITNNIGFRPSGSMNIVMEGCYFEDNDDESIGDLSTDGSATKDILGCLFHDTVAAPSAYSHISGSGGGSDYIHIVGCRATTDDNSSGHGRLFSGYGVLADRCRVIGLAGGLGYFSTADGNIARRCITTGCESTGLYFYSDTGTATIDRCTFRDVQSNYKDAIRCEPSGWTVTIRNCAMADYYYGLRVYSGSTFDNSYNSYYNIDDPLTEVGTGDLNDPETGQVTGDPTFDTNSQDGCIPLAGSPLIDAGTSADGLPYNGTAPDIGAVEVMPIALRDQ